MANHGYVFDCKEPLDPRRIQEITEELCQTRLKGLFRVEFTGEENPWGEHSWVILYNGISKKYNFFKEFWIGKYYNNSKEVPAIEIRHGGGDNLRWWIDWSLINLLAEKLGGTIGDDGADECAPNYEKYPTLRSYCLRGGEFEWYKFAGLGQTPKDLQKAFPVPKSPIQRIGDFIDALS